MGYYSSFTITTHDGSDLPTDFMEQLEQISGYRFEQVTPSTAEASDTIKWYDHDEHMAKLSELFPDILFTVYRNGEDTEDEYIYYYLDGQSESSPVTKTFAPPTLKPIGPKFGTIKSLT